jgi:predicted DNA-binding protein YlxM (UPF0122 family)
MNEKKLFISQLYDYYGELLTEKQQYAVEMYYNDDLSLSEIAESIGITRQGVRDQLKHAEEFLVSCEEKLGLAEKIQKVLDLKLIKRKNFDYKQSGCAYDGIDVPSVVIPRNET